MINRASPKEKNMRFFRRNFSTLEINLFIENQIFFYTARRDVFSSEGFFMNLYNKNCFVSSVQNLPLLSCHILMIVFLVDLKFFYLPINSLGGSNANFILIHSLL